MHQRVTPSSPPCQRCPSSRCLCNSGSPAASTPSTSRTIPIKASSLRISRKTVKTSNTLKSSIGLTRMSRIMCWGILSLAISFKLIKASSWGWLTMTIRVPFRKKTNTVSWRRMNFQLRASISVTLGLCSKDRRPSLKPSISIRIMKHLSPCEF